MKIDFRGYYFYDGYKKACTLYSNVDDTYFKGHFCAQADHNTREVNLTNKIMANKIQEFCPLTIFYSSSRTLMVDENVNTIANKNKN